MSLAASVYNTVKTVIQNVAAPFYQGGAQDQVHFSEGMQALQGGTVVAQAGAINPTKVLSENIARTESMTKSQP